VRRLDAAFDWREKGDDVICEPQNQTRMPN